MAACWLHHLVFMFLQASALFTLCKGSIQCVCTTIECQNEEKAICTSEHMCYVQNMQEEVPGNPGLKQGIIRGCIDDRTPLLCENRKPQAYTGPWPVLHCCKEEWCNKDVVPTVPTPWLEEMKKNAEDGENAADSSDLLGGKLSPDNGPYHQQNDQGQYDSQSYQDENVSGAKIYRPRQQSRSKTINPLYIAVPVAGACVLLAIIIFAIYILKRQNAMMAEYHQQHVKQQNQKLCPIYNGNAKLAHQHFHHHPYHHHQHPLNGQQQTLIHKAPKAGDPSQDLSAAQNSKHKLYSDSTSERSSTGSETKLLMKV